MRASALLLLASALAASAAPCDIYGAAGTPCVAAHSLVRALFSSYSGPLYRVMRTADNRTLDITVLSPGGFANAAAQDAFCGTNATAAAAAAAASASSPAASFAASLPLGTIVNIVPSVLPAYSFRHCDAQGFVTETDMDLDHQFKLVAPLNGAQGALSFQSVNYPTYYISPMTGAPEPGRVGVVENPDAGDASWAVTPTGTGASASSPFSSTAATVTLTNLGAAHNGLLLGVGTNLTGSCAGNYQPPSASVYLLGASAGASTQWTLSSLSPGPCVVTRIYDQSPRANHLDTAPAGGAVNRPDNPVDATKLKLSVGGHEVYGAYFQGGQGYRIDNTSGVATGNDPETIYMVTSGLHFNGGCCFDYGNAEVNNHDDGAGTMECVYFGTWNATASGWCGGAGQGPWVMSDLENGLWACGDPSSINPNVTGFSTTPFVFAQVKGGTDGFSLKGGNATAAGALATLYDGPRPPGYQPMKKQGALILGIGGDNSDSAIGSFFEGVVLSGLSTDAADEAVFADIVAAGYGK